MKTYNYLYLQCDKLLVERLFIGQLFPDDINGSFLFLKLHLEETNLFLSSLKFNVTITNHCVYKYSKDSEIMIQEKYEKHKCIQKNTAMMAVWYKVLPSTASCLSPHFGFRCHAGHMRKLPVTSG